jgi:CheY-like chemotaxis protein
MILNLETFDLRQLVHEIIEGFCERAFGKGLELICECDPEIPDTVSGDPGRLGQILTNLIGNAVKFTETGSIDVAVRPLAVDGRTVRLAISVCDTGIGMTAEQAARVFDPFSQADNSTTRRYGGTGLGLSIVRRLVELMGGDATVDSAPGKGSTFTVTLTLAVAEPEACAEATQAAATPAQLAGRVLAVDDYPINLEVLVAQLEILGVPVDAAVNGLEALTLWRTRPYRLILTDIHMPDMDGLELARQIRSEENHAGDDRHVPILALTANAVKGEADHCLAAGMDGYLTKPLTLERLRVEVERWMASPSPIVQLRVDAPEE